MEASLADIDEAHKEPNPHVRAPRDGYVPGRTQPVGAVGVSPLG